MAKPRCRQPRQCRAFDIVSFHESVNSHPMRNKFHYPPPTPTYYDLLQPSTTYYCTCCCCCRRRSVNTS
eukprot:6070657-Amphidinium_carterae.1